MKSKNEQLESAGAIGHCMETVGLRPLTIQTHKAQAKFRLPRETRCRGNVFLTFDLFSSMRGWEVNCATDTMKGYNIPRGNFDRDHQLFSFDEEARELTITGDDFCFVLRF